MAYVSPLQNLLRLKIFSRKLFQLGELDVLYASEGVFVFTRKLESQIALVAVNSGSQKKKVRVVTDPGLLLNGTLGETAASNDNGEMQMTLEGLSTQLFINAAHLDLVV